jgi:hypothetical protein
MKLLGMHLLAIKNPATTTQQAGLSIYLVATSQLHYLLSSANAACCVACGGLHGHTTDDLSSLRVVSGCRQRV